MEELTAPWGMTASSGCASWRRAGLGPNLGPDLGQSGRCRCLLGGSVELRMVEPSC